MLPDRWDDARRVEAWAGETRVNLIRAIALVVFYAHHLLNVYVFKDPTLGTEAQRSVFHGKVTAIVLAWAVGVFVLHLCLFRRYVPPVLPFVAVGWDLVLVSLLVGAAPEGPRSPLIFLYFVVVASSPLRMSLPVVWFTTFGTMVAAVLLMGYYVLFQIGGFAAYYSNEKARIPHASEVIFLLAIGACGLLAGQVVRQARRLVRGYPVIVEGPREAA
jgi:hypothetical protein